MDRPRLAPNLIRFCIVSNRLRTSIHVALTARRELHSRSIPCLEKPQGTDKERNKQREPQDRAHSSKDKQKGDHDTHNESHGSEPATWFYVEADAETAVARHPVSYTHLTLPTKA